MCMILSVAIFFNKEDAVAVSVAGLTIFHKWGCCIQHENWKTEEMEC